MFLNKWYLKSWQVEKKIWQIPHNKHQWMSQSQMKSNWKHTRRFWGVLQGGERPREVLILIKGSRYFGFDQEASGRIMGYSELEGTQDYRWPAILIKRVTNWKAENILRRRATNGSVLRQHSHMICTAEQRLVVMMPSLNLTDTGSRFLWQYIKSSK